NIRAVILSHGHLDHIGAAPILLEKLGYPVIVGRDLTLEMTKEKVEDRQKGASKNMKMIRIKSLQDKLKFGAFEVEFFQIEHSIMDAVGIILKTPAGTIVHSGDWTLEKDRDNKPLLDYSFLSKLPRPTFLMMESLGAIDVRKSASQEEMEKNLRELIANAPGRVIIGTFSSQIERVAFIIETAQRLNKQVALDGYSMKTNIELAKNLGYIKASKKTLIGINETTKLDDKKVVIICTGAQGEGEAVLSRIITGNHRYITLKKTDTVILSSSIIPGNERSIQQLKDNLYRQCDNVIHGELMEIHVSGHGNRQDIIYMLKEIQPDYFIPVYAYHYMLKEAAKLAERVGFDKNKIFVADNGQVIEIPVNGQPKLTDKRIPADYVLIDGPGVDSLNSVVLKDRLLMGNDGMLVLIVTLDKNTGLLKTNPDIISRGFIYMKENKELVEKIREKVQKIAHGQDVSDQDKISAVKENIKDKVGQFVYSKTGRRPMILPVVITV
ncbi:MAG: ribonuclease J, partial [Patescibacteria group bacterium]